ncbi:MAG TPA: PDZ domain-containing protein [Bryobacteraceae bacterium]|jgi:predicted metalloprotease with PDZ domain|nr:PDZ domain-containing protein [Bryobacteraceae bacterium]
MRSVSNRKLTVILLALGASAAAEAQCVTLGDDRSCRSGCCLDSNCDTICTDSLRANFNPLMPGFLVQETGTKAVALVVPHSPAAASGMLSGDEIVSVDGQSLYSTGGVGWQEARTRTILVRRHGSPLILRVTPTPLSAILARLGSRTDSEPSVRPAGLPLPPYVSGFVVSRSSDCPWVITFVLHGSAAERAGIWPGDRIVAINGIDTERLDRRHVQIEGAEQPLAIAVTVRRGAALHSAELQMTGISDVIKHLAEDPSTIYPDLTLATGDPR